MKMVTINSQLADYLNHHQGKIDICPDSGLYMYAHLETQLKNADERKNIRLWLYRFRLDLFCTSRFIIVLMGPRTIKELDEFIKVFTKDIPCEEKIAYKQFLKDLKAFEENMEAA